MLLSWWEEGGTWENTNDWNMNCYEDSAEQFGTVSNLRGFSYSRCISKNSSYKIKIVSQDMYSTTALFVMQNKQTNWKQSKDSSRGNW